MEVDDPITQPDGNGDVPPRDDVIDRGGPRRLNGSEARRGRHWGNRG